MSTSQITKRALADSLKECVKTTPFEKISITDICKDCGLNRKSFYYHFHDKYALAIWIFEDELGSSIKKDMDFQSATFPLVLQICTYFEENRVFYANVLQSVGPHTLRDHLARRMQPLVLRTLTMDDGNMPLDGEEISLLVGDFFLAALLRWLKRTPPTSALVFLSELSSAAIALTKRILQLLDNTPN
ncbi:MAG: TetR/AcrR family transcriptional regulator C-terminal domain-containing protein [Sphaerochaetaceae bacterium]